VSHPLQGVYGCACVVQTHTHTHRTVECALLGSIARYSCNDLDRRSIVHVSESEPMKEIHVYRSRGCGWLPSPRVDCFGEKVGSLHRTPSLEQSMHEQRPRVEGQSPHLYYYPESLPSSNIARRAGGSCTFSVNMWHPSSTTRNTQK
jgi:hypothetical protein